MREAEGRLSRPLVVAAAGPPDHDLVLLDRDLDGPVARPVLGVDGVVLDGGVEPQAVALLAVVEGALERPGALAAAPRRRRPRRRFGARRASPRLVLVLGPRPRLAASSATFASSSAAAPPRPRARRRWRRRPRRAGRPLRRSAPSALALAVGLELVLALERLDLLDGHLELVRDPGVGAALAHPPANLIQLGTQRPAAHGGAGD